MSNIPFTRVYDLGLLPYIVHDSYGNNGLKNICSQQDLDFKVLEDNNNLILYKDYMGLFENAALITGDQVFGLNVGKYLGALDFGSLSHYVLGASTLRQAFERLLNAYKFHESHTTIALSRHQNELLFTYSSVEQGSPGWRHIADTAVCLFIDLIRQYTGPNWKPQQIELSYEKGPWAQPLEDFFQVPVIFNRPLTGLTFDSNIMNASKLENSPAVDFVCIQDLKEDLTPPPENTTKAVEQLIRQSLSSKKSSLENIAHKIDCGPRSLQRHLSQEGHTYRECLQKVRQEHCFNLLSDKTMPIKQIASSLGYQSDIQFYQAFRSWTGTSPLEYRKTILQIPRKHL